MSDSPEDDAWLARPSTIRKLWQLFWFVLALTVVAQVFIKVKGYFGVDGWFAFGAIYGFLCCLAMVLFAKAIGNVLKRDENFYSGDGDDV